MWPPTENEVRRLIAGGESPLVEFKQSWYNLENKAGKAELAKDIIALANTALPRQPGYLIIGVRDRKHGGGLLGLSTAIDEGQLGQILGSYVVPPPDVRLHYVKLDEAGLAVLGVFSSLHIYQSARSYEGDLEPNVPYVRRNDGVGRLSIVEMQDRLLARASASSIPLALDPIEFGIVEVGSFSGPRNPTVRLTNVSDEPVTDVDVMFDVTWRRDPTVCHRTRGLSTLTLAPGQSRETELQLRNLSLYRGNEDILRLVSSNIGVRWLDVEALVRFRDRRGFLQERRAPLTIAE
jgi:hypothetical protein